MRIQSILYTLVFVFSFSILNSQQVAKSEKGTFLLKNGTLVTVSNGTFKSDLLLKDGKIAEIGESLSAGDGVTVVDCSDKFVYPGFIDGGTQLGLQEIGAVSLTSDHNEIGDFIPHMEALTAVNPNGVAIPVTRVNGITSAIVKPTGGRFPGTAALINLHGYTPQQMYAGYKAVVMNYPSSGKRGRRDRRSEEDIKKDSEKARKDLNESWKKVQLYSKIDAASKSSNQEKSGYNPSMDAMIDVVNGDQQIMIEVNKKADIEAAIEWVKENQLNAVLTGVKEGYRVAEELAEAGIPVIVGPVLSIPSRQSDKYDIAYANPGIMAKAGVKVALRTDSYENVRNLPYEAGFAATYGMGTEEALKAITLNTAEIFGLSDQLGSLDIGKLANVFVSDGDPFETSTDILHLFIGGYKVPLESRQTLLYDEFLNRDPGVEKK
jgi:imidazolonepropionase-like amidohydrolase